VTTDGRQARDELREGWRAAGWYPDLTIGEALAAAASAHSEDRLIFAQVEGATTTLSLGDLWQRSCRCAGSLAAAGVRSGDTVVLQAPADARSTEVLVALWTLGAVPVPLTTAATNEDVAHAVRQTRSRTVVLVREWRGRDLVSGLVSHKTSLGLETVVVLGSEAPRGAVSLDAVGPSVLSDDGRPAPTSEACVIYTSGSTAQAKGVRHSHETLLCGLGIMPVDPTSRMLGTFPAGHVASLLGLLRPLTAGGTTVIMDRWSARAAAELVEEHRITVSAGTPFFLSTLLNEAEREGRDISSLTRFLVGAAAVPPSLVERANAAGIVTWRTYGSTEHPAISSGGPDDPSEKRQLTDGRVTPGNEVRLIDESGIDVTSGQEGEIVARGPKQFLSYGDDALDESAFFESTWFRTGDLARFDDDGYLVVTDRIKDIIIRGGENISAREIEDILARHPAVEEVAVCAAPDAIWGEAVCAVVIAKPGLPQPTLKELAAMALSAGLSPHKLPTRLELTNSLPRTAAGKVRKRDLRPLLTVDGG
jgi:cyclohexanecarboxylate-CoA ligase